MNKFFQKWRTARRQRSPYYGRNPMGMLALYLLAMVGLVLGIVLLFFVGYALYRSIQDLYWSSLVSATMFPFQMLLWGIYNVAQFVRDTALFLVWMLFVVGWMIITYLFLRWGQRDLSRVIAMADRLTDPGKGEIELPPALAEAEARLNLARQKALTNAAAAREAEQRKNDLIMYLAHDLKTPLTSVIGYLTLLQDEPQISTELRARYTGIALHKAQRLEDLINEFFEITRFNLSHLELDTQPVDLKRLLEQVVSEFEPVFREKRLRCTLDLPAELRYEGDPDKLARVFDNLLRNAEHYSFPDTCVEIQARQEEDAITLQFTNAGRTIPPEKLDRLFEQFFRLDSSRGTSSGGAGLGLAIARQIVQAHGGTIRADSADNTITFTVTLPIARKS